MKKSTLLVSAALHAALAAVALRAATTTGRSAAIEVTVAAPKPGARPEEAKPEPTAGREPEAPRVPARAPRAPSVPAEAAPEAQAPGPAAPRHLEIGVSMSNADAPGVAVGPSEPGSSPDRAGRPPPAAPEPPPKEKILGAPRPAATDDCAEAATKPIPVSRPSSIDYTTQARADGAQGRLVLAITVAPDGSVTAVQLKSGVHASIDAAAMSAVRAWRFTPAMRCGKAVEGTYTLARRFELGD